MRDCSAAGCTAAGRGRLHLQLYVRPAVRAENGSHGGSWSGPRGRHSFRRWRSHNATRENTHMIAMIASLVVVLPRPCRPHVVAFRRVALPCALPLGFTRAMLVPLAFGLRRIEICIHPEAHLGFPSSTRSRLSVSSSKSEAKGKAFEVREVCAVSKAMTVLSPPPSLPPSSVFWLPSVMRAAREVLRPLPGSGHSPQLKG